MRRPLPLLAAAGLLAALLAAVAPAAADVLVTRDGERVETRGPWEVKGRLVVFTTAGGRLASLRAADVDLEASREATRTAGETPAAGDAEETRSERQPQRRSSGRRITNADIGPGQGPPPAAAPQDGEAGEGGEEAAERGEVRRELAVLGIERSFAPVGHAVVRGTVRNTAAEAAVGVSLTIHLHDVDGGLAGSADAELGTRALEPGAETTFVAEFPEVFAYESLRLVPRATFLATTAGEDSAAASEDGAADDAGTP